MRSIPAENMVVFIGGRRVPIVYVGPQLLEEGMDQVAVGLPLDLRGSGEIDVVVQINGVLSNTGRLNVL
jgi:uncharacterized protein (TIGR03437 family)